MEKTSHRENHIRIDENGVYSKRTALRLHYNQLINYNNIIVVPDH